MKGWHLLIMDGYVEFFTKKGLIVTCMIISAAGLICAAIGSFMVAGSLDVGLIADGIAFLVMIPIVICFFAGLKSDNLNMMRIFAAFSVAVIIMFDITYIMRSFVYPDLFQRSSTVISFLIDLLIAAAFFRAFGSSDSKVAEGAVMVMHVVMMVGLMKSFFDLIFDYLIGKDLGAISVVYILMMCGIDAALLGIYVMLGSAVSKIKMSKLGEEED